MTAAPPLAVLGTSVPGGRRRLERDLARLLRHASRVAGRTVEVSFAVVSDAAMRDLHRRALGEDRPTDVLAFPLAGAGGPEGEVVCSAETARREAARRGTDPYHELVLYAVHGLLHLVGHDDRRPAARARMRRAERRALAALEIGPVFAGHRRARRAR